MLSCNMFHSRKIAQKFICDSPFEFAAKSNNGLSCLCQQTENINLLSNNNMIETQRAGNYTSTSKLVAVVRDDVAVKLTENILRL